ncbi:flagellar protein FlaG [Reinekea blandensis]|uniref:Uncharacterized flagellar protein FlaG n=1 Tax=Reinekea blandensis MED297 TaxID=314283 RepID=A4BEN8_9GAMM|nr:flagellar protein FlaG [Reinekea blandensis]EAR09465.1 uncharacterized flagellar protein FlaG [Reinekea sp. MED297] [Reinekea blandensis MED297]
MSDISIQQTLTARASAPAKDAGKQRADAQDVSSKGQASEARQTEKASGLSPLEIMQKQRAEEQKDENVERAVAQLNDYVQNTERKLEFQLDDESGDTIVRVYDKNSDELIRQIPNEEAVELARRLNQEEPLSLFSAQV